MSFQLSAESLFAFNEFGGIAYYRFCNLLYLYFKYIPMGGILLSTND